MHKHYFITITLLFVFCFKSVGQTEENELQGKWYMFSRNRVVGLEFSKDRIITKQLNWDLSEREPGREQVQRITHSAKANGNTYVCLRTDDDTANQIRVNTFRIVRPGKEMLFVINSTEKLFTNMDSVQQYIDHDVTDKYGFNLYSQAEMEQFKKLKKINTMTAPDFEIYVGKIIHLRSVEDSLSKQLADPEPSGIIYYGYSMLRVFFLEIGYDPLVTTKELDDLFKRFADTPAAKKLLGGH
ncbi:hypothetical protein [Ferruginibacter sp.]